MKRHAILCGSAPDGFTQKKINEMHDFLTSEASGFWAEKEITTFPNGVDEAMLSFVLERLKADKTEQILLYICTLSPVADEDKSLWLGENEIHKSVIEGVASTSSATANHELVEPVARRHKRSEVTNGIQVFYDTCRDFIPDEETDDDAEVFSAGFSGFSRSAGEIE